MRGYSNAGGAVDENLQIALIMSLSDNSSKKNKNESTTVDVKKQQQMQNARSDSTPQPRRNQVSTMDASLRGPSGKPVPTKRPSVRQKCINREGTTRCQPTKRV